MAPNYGVTVSSLPRSLGEEIETILPIFLIYDELSILFPFFLFFFPSPSPSLLLPRFSVFPPTIERVASKHLLNGKRSFRIEFFRTKKTISRRSSLEKMFNCHCGSFKYGPRIEHETRPKRNQRGVRITGLSIGSPPPGLYIDCCKLVPFIHSFFFFFFHALSIRIPPPVNVRSRIRIATRRRIMKK